MKKKSHALRKRVLALVAALFLICLTAVPAFADDVSTITLNGKYYFQSGVTLSDYFVEGTTYSPVSGSFQIYHISNDTAINSSTYSTFSVSYWSGLSYFALAANYPNSGSSGSSVMKTATAAESGFSTAVFNPDGKYLVFTDYVVYTNSEIFEFLRDCRGAGSTVSFRTPVEATDLTDVITGGFNGLITGLGSGVADYFETLFLAEGGGLTTFATVSLVLLGVGLSIGIARWIIHKVGQ